VRLRQGDYTQETVFGDDPMAVALRWVKQGAQWLHVVDLDGAKVGRPINEAAIRGIVDGCGVPCQFGGGLRTTEDISTALAWGVERVVIGTRALKAPGWFEEVCQRWPGRVVLGIDAKNGMVAAEGWLEVSEIPALELAQRCASWPLAAVVYTDISRDGMLQGVNVEVLAAMVAAVRMPVIASGGVTTLDDIKLLAERGLAGCIIGRALYEGRLELKEALKMAAAI
jgi:phosphoribosylformimino-5-aminoimidazole carboxamide ribotide isomerase